MENEGGWGLQGQEGKRDGAHETYKALGADQADIRSFPSYISSATDTG